MSAPATITILQCDRGAASRKTGRRFTATKTWRIGDRGKVECVGFDAGTYFRCRCYPVSDINHLYKILSQLQRRPLQFLIRGLPNPTVDLSESVRRMKHPDHDNDDVNWFVEGNGQPWVLIDIDNLPVPPEIDPVRDPEAAIDFRPRGVRRAKWRNAGAGVFRGYLFPGDVPWAFHRRKPDYLEK
jgi:hypothetical protein